MSETTQTTLLSVGSAAPDFTLPDQHGTLVHLAEELAQNWVVLFFYPKDHSPICTSQVCAFRNAYDEFRAAGVELLGVSTDSVAFHARFASSYSLPFRLLSDADDRVRRLYGVPKTFGLIPGRVTYVINQESTVRMVHSSQFSARTHMKKALDLLRLEGRR